MNYPFVVTRGMKTFHYRPASMGFLTNKMRRVQRLTCRRVTEPAGLEVSFQIEGKRIVNLVAYWKTDAEFIEWLGPKRSIRKVTLVWGGEYATVSEFLERKGRETNNQPA